jgi:phospholipid-binding lipoprotein MlaA
MPASHQHFSTRFLCLLLPLLLLGGCATGKDPRDPFEPFNRGVYQFNEAVDKAILKPVAEGYRKIVPQFVRSIVSNFFSNISDIIVALNNVLQGKFKAAYTDFGRVAINSTLGILGLFDIATEAGIEKHNEDFGQTLGWWGVRDGPFIMLPFFGPSNARDTVGRVGDYFSNPVTYVDPNGSRYALYGTDTVNRRSELLEAGEVLRTAALDPYEFVRDAYLQRRRNLIHDGKAPPEREFLDPPPRPQGSAPREPAFPIAGEQPSGLESILVSGESRSPVQSTYSQPAPSPAPAAAGKAAASAQRPLALTGDGTPVVTGEPMSALQAELLAPGQLTINGAPPTAQRELPRLAELWRALKLKP